MTRVEISLLVLRLLSLIDKEIILLCITSFTAITTAWLGYKTKKIAQDQKSTHEHMEQLEKNTDGQLDKLIKLTEESSHAKGVLDEKERVK